MSLTDCNDQLIGATRVSTMERHINYLYLGRTHHVLQEHQRRTLTLYKITWKSPKTNDKRRVTRQQTLALQLTAQGKGEQVSVIIQEDSQTELPQIHTFLANSGHFSFNVPANDDQYLISNNAGKWESA